MKRGLLKDILSSSVAEKIIGTLAYFYLKFVGMTTRWKVIGVDEAYKTLDKHKAMIVIGWHGRTLEMPYFWNKSSKLNALVSPHRDGRLIVAILHMFGIGNIDGSSNKDSSKAAIHLMKNLQQGNSIAIIPDGPRGPSMTLGLSPLFYAQKSGKPIMGITYSIANSKIVHRSWDNMLIPLPFQRGIYVITEPMIIPKNATPEELEQYRQTLENKLNDITWKIDEELGIEHVERGKSRKSRV